MISSGSLRTDVEQKRKKIELINFERIDHMKETFEKQIYDVRRVTYNLNLTQIQKISSNYNEMTNLHNKVGDMFVRMQTYAVRSEVNRDVDKIWENFRQLKGDIILIKFY